MSYTDLEDFLSSLTISIKKRNKANRKYLSCHDSNITSKECLNILERNYLEPKVLHQKLLKEMARSRKISTKKYIELSTKCRKEPFFFFELNIHLFPLKLKKLNKVFHKRAK